jgi:hypothetical protein
MCLQKNFQRVLVVHFGNDYSECCKDVLDILNEDEDILQEYNDSYIQVIMEMATSFFYHDIYKEKESLAYPTKLVACCKPNNVTDNSIPVRGFVETILKHRNRESGKSIIDEHMGKTFSFQVLLPRRDV